MKKTSSSLLCLTLLSLGTMALAEEKKEEEKPKKPWSISADLTYSQFAKTDLGRSLALSPAFSFKTNDRDSYKISQSYTHPYQVDKGESKIQPSDMTFSYTRKLSDLKDNNIANFKLTLSATAPMSEFSRNEKVKSTPGITLGGSRAFFNDVLSYSLSTFYYYHINSYKSMGIDDGGAYLIQQRYGLSQNIGVELPFDFSLNWSAGYQERRYENKNITPTHRYSSSVGVGYNVNDDLSISAGYEHTDLAEKMGLVDINLYDVEVSSYYASVSYKL